MKGAKIKIRSSLTRKPSLNLNSPKIQEVRNEDKKSEVGSPAEEPTPSKLLFSDVDEPENIFNSEFKLKIVQNLPKMKQPFNLRGIAQSSSISKLSSRNVDLEWLDECLSAESNTQKPSVNYDQDIIYSSDDEKSRKPVHCVPKSASKKAVEADPVESPSDSKRTSHESSPTPTTTTALKRKSEEIDNSNKKPRMDSTEDSSSTKEQICREYPVKEHSPKESSVNAVKRERLARYLPDSFQ